MIIKFDNTITSWDEGLPLGNGDIGCLVWGGANKLRFSLDKGDIWDTSGQPSENANFKYSNIVKWSQTGDVNNIRKTFDSCYSKPNPTKLPVGAIEFNFLTKENVVSQLNLYTGEVELKINDINIKSYVHSDLRVGIIDINSINFNINLDIPKFGTMPKRWWHQLGSGGITQSLKNLHYEKSNYTKKTIGDIEYQYFIQKVNKDLSYGVLFGIKKSTNNTQIAYTVINSKDKIDYLQDAFNVVTDALSKGYDALLVSHKEWWKTYWSRAQINIPDKTLQRGWNIGNYLLGSGSRKGFYPMPLQGLWTADNGQLPPWKGDYHHDLNTQLTYFSYAKANQIKAGECFIDYLLNLKEVGQKFAKDFYGLEGLSLPAVMDINGGALGGWAMYSLSPTNMLWLMDIIGKHYDYTLDNDKLKSQIYPYFVEVEKLIKGLFIIKNGKYYLPWSSSAEIHDNTARAFLTPNSNYDLALLKKFYLNMIKYSKVLGLDYKIFEETLSKLDDLAIAKDKVLMISPDEKLTESHRHHSHMMSIFPLRLLNYDKDFAIIDATIKDMEKLGTKNWTGYSFAWLSEFYVVQRQGEKAQKTLQTFFDYFCLPNGFHINGDYTKQGLSNLTYRPFTLEGNFCAIDAIQEMLLFSNDRIIEPLRAVPKDWTDFSFDNLRAEGGVLVSLKYAKGQLAELTLMPTKDIKVKLVNKFTSPFSCNKEYQQDENFLVFELLENQIIRLEIIK